jgi:OOP family OmpA-OmpF porin
MRLGPTIVSLCAVLIAAGISWVGAVSAAGMIERLSAKSVKTELIKQGFDWADVETDGLQVIVTGTAPTEAVRFRALAKAGGIVDATRVVDGTDVQEAKPLQPPEFAVELLRNDDGISMIGLIPTDYDRDEITQSVNGLSDATQINDLLETADYPIPDDWELHMGFALEALERLPRSKISVSANDIRITAISDSPEEKARLEASIARSAPRGVNLALDISAPRPVITPFTLRFISNPAADIAPRFDACSTDTLVARARILSSARKAGLEGKATCVLGLGAPTPEWADAVEQGIAAVAELGGGTVTFSDADVTLVALPGTARPVFDRVVGEMESNLPDVFSLSSVLPDPPVVDGTGDADEGPPEFVATRSPEGQVQLRGRLTDDQVREAVESFARSRFGVESVYAAARLDPSLPEGWPIRVRAGLQALSELDSGSVIVQPDYLELRGSTGNKNARAEISRLLSDRLGEAQNFEIAVRYDEKLDPTVDLPTPEECIGRINLIVASQKITFEPSSVDITGAAIRVMDEIAEVLKSCKSIEMEIEIGGHTDSQGREEMNRDLSQQRANAVLDALTARRVLTGNITARGYGETTPIADNETEDGREANRRIEFRLVEVVETVEEDSDTDAASENSTQTDTDAATDTATETEAETTGEQGTGTQGE